MRAMARKKKLKEFWVAVIFGVICSIFITLIILLLNLKRVF